MDLQWNREFALEQTAGDEELLEELIVLFKDSSASDYQQLQEAVSAGNTDGIIAAAHSLKGAAASLGVEGIFALAKEIEMAGRDNRLEGLEGPTAEMGSLIEQLQEI